MQQSTVVVEQPRRAQAPLNISEWSSELCGCFDDCGMCCYAFFCFHCFMCDMAGRMKEFSCGPYCVGAAFIIAMRTKMRIMYGIKGTICDDCCMVGCCEFCAVLQMMRELKFQESVDHIANTSTSIAIMHQERREPAYDPNFNAPYNPAYTPDNKM